MGTDEQDDSAVDAFLDSISDPEQRADRRDLASMLAEITDSPGHVANENVVGFGRVHYRYASGRAGDTFKIGFARRTRRLTLYVLRRTRTSLPLAHDKAFHHAPDDQCRDHDDPRREGDPSTGSVGDELHGSMIAPVR